MSTPDRRLLTESDITTAGPLKTQLDVAKSHAARHAEGGADPITPASIGAASASRFRSGAGSPEGVISAPTGTEYTDTAGTRGAWKWLKKSGTGTTGWRVTDGDTGWQTLAPYLMPGHAIPSQSVLEFAWWKRANGMVHIHIQLPVPSGVVGSSRGTVVKAVNLNGFPGGLPDRAYAPNVGVAYRSRDFLGTVGNLFTQYEYSYRPSNETGTYVASDTYVIISTYTTSSPWPASF